MHRFHQTVLIGSAILGSWLAMQAVHELGHVVGAWWTGGEVVRVVLHPLTISRTDLASNPRPLLVVWAGPVIGVMVPAMLWVVAVAARMSGAFLLRFFLGFCMIANGVYIAFGSIDRIGDSGEMLRHGSEPWQLWTFGAVTAPLGLWIWHGLGPSFGLGPCKGKVDSSVAYLSAVLCLLLLVLEYVFGAP